MKNLLRSAILGLCLSMPFANATPGAFAIQNTTTISTDTIDYAIQQFKADMLSADTVKTLSSLSQNAPWVLGTAFLGFLGFDMVRKSLHTMVDKKLALDKNEHVTYQKLIAKAAIGAGLLGAAGWGIRTILK